MLNKTRALILRHKFISGVIIILLLVGGYYGYGALFSKKAGTTYVTSAATNGTITTSVSGSGQVAASGTINLQFQGSGTLIYLGVKNGQNVSAGQLIAQLDTTDAEKTVRDAQASLDAAQLSLQKLEGASTLAVPQNKQDAINTLNQDYQSSYNTVSSVFTDLPAIMTDLQNVIYGNSFTNTQENIDFYTGSAATYDQSASQFRSNLVSSYAKALSEYTTNFNDYKSTTRTSDNNTIDTITTETYNTTKDVAQAIKDTNNLIQFYKNTLAVQNIKENPVADTQLVTVNSDSAKADSDITSLLSTQNTVAKDTEAVANSDLDIQSQKLSVENAQNSLQDAKDTLSNYYIYSPFNGTVGNVTVQNLNTVGSGTVVATLITTQKICTVPLNEVDVSKVQVGQQVVLTFDALPNLTVAGAVATINPVGTVTQGVVTYNVQINFDTQDSRVKSGMSINAQIITNVAQNVLIVPNVAIKTQGTTKYVQVLINNIPTQKIVTVGLTNATNTQILTGLNVGDKVITQTVTTGVASTTGTTSTSTVRIPGLGGGGGFSGGAARGGL
jgi:HlyD family secretion protein